MDAEVKKKVLRLYTYGMYVVSAHHDRDDGIFLANWVSQCSFEPPLIMLSIKKDARTLPLILANGFFAIHVLASGQREVAGMLGKSFSSQPNKLAKVRWKPSPLTGCPILQDTLGYVECRVTGQLAAGDSTIVVGEVIEAQMLSDGELSPLTMRETGFKHFG